MKNLFLIVLISCFLISCATPDKEYVIATNAAFETIVPVYCTYIEADKRIKDFDSKARIQASKEALELSREELKRIKE